MSLVSRARNVGKLIHGGHLRKTVHRARAVSHGLFKPGTGLLPRITRDPALTQLARDHGRVLLHKAIRKPLPPGVYVWKPRLELHKKEASLANRAGQGEINLPRQGFLRWGKIEAKKTAGTTAAPTRFVIYLAVSHRTIFQYEMRVSASKEPHAGIFKTTLVDGQAVNKKPDWPWGPFFLPAGGKNSERRGALRAAVEEDLAITRELLELLAHARLVAKAKIINHEEDTVRCLDALLSLAIIREEVDMALL